MTNKVEGLSLVYWPFGNCLYVMPIQDFWSFFFLLYSVKFQVDLRLWLSPPSPPPHTLAVSPLLKIHIAYILSQSVPFSYLFFNGAF